MALSVIGAGLGRTGTLSLKQALETLGVGRCYHMTEVFPDPAAPRKWLRAILGEMEDWEDIFAGYGATVDWPGCHYYRELARRYSAAKVVLSVRDPDQWYDSARATILSDETAASVVGTPAQTLVENVVYGTFDRRLDDRAHCIAAFERHNAAVQAKIPAERLLVYDVAEGWGPLCDFLGLPVPETAFPTANSRESFHEDLLPEAVRQLNS